MRWRCELDGKDFAGVFFFGTLAMLQTIYRELPYDMVQPLKGHLIREDEFGIAKAMPDTKR